MRTKTEVLKKFQEFIAQNGTPNILRTENGTEYTNRKFKQFCVHNKLRQVFTVPETPERSGFAEGKQNTVGNG